MLGASSKRSGIFAMAAEAINAALENFSGDTCSALVVAVSDADIPSHTKAAVVAESRAHLMRVCIIQEALKKCKRNGQKTPDGSSRLPTIARTSERQQRRVLLAQLKACESVAASGSVEFTAKAAATLLDPLLHIIQDHAADMLARKQEPLNEVLRLIEFSYK